MMSSLGMQLFAARSFTLSFCGSVLQTFIPLSQDIFSGNEGFNTEHERAM